MITREVTVGIEKGLHARPAAVLVKKLNEFSSTVEFAAGTKKLNPKSVLSLMTAVIKQGEALQVTVDGPDEQKTMEWLVEFLQKEKA